MPRDDEQLQKQKPRSINQKIKKYKPYDNSFDALMKVISETKKQTPAKRLVNEIKRQET